MQRKVQKEQMLNTLLSVGLATAGFIGTTIKYATATVVMVGALAVFTKPSEESLLPYARQWANKSAIQAAAEELVDPSKKPAYQDVIFFRVAEYEKMRFYGVFGAWFKY